MMIVTDSKAWYNVSVSMDVNAYWTSEDVATYAPSLTIFYGSFIFICALISIAGNIVIIAYFLKPRPSNIYHRRYVLSLAFSDLITALFYWMPCYSSFRGVWSFGQIGCTFYGFLQGYCSLVSICTVAVIAFERSTAMKKPYFVAATDQARKQLGTIFGVWFYAFMISGPPLFGWSRYTPVGSLTSCCFEFMDTRPAYRAFFIYLFVGGFFIPCAIIIFSYASIFTIITERKLTGQSTVDETMIMMPPLCSTTSSTPNPMSISGTKRREKNQSRSRRKETIKTLKTMLIVVTAFVVAWTPYALLATIGQFGPWRHKLIGPYSMTLASVCAKSATMFNPFIYSNREDDLRKAIMKTLAPNKTKPKPQTSETFL